MLTIDILRVAIQILLFKGDVAFSSVALLLLLAVFGFLFK